MANQTPARLPLLFSYRDTLFGNGFLVEVQIQNGRALGVQEADGFWMYGINPGGMAASGTDLDTAHAAFRKTFSDMLVGLAIECDSFETFQAAVDVFARETNAGFEPDWESAVAAVRRDKIAVAGLAQAPAASPLSVTVSLKTQPRAEDNVPVSDALLAA